MEPIQTTMGTGWVVGAMAGGRVVAAVPVVKRVPAAEKGKPPVEKKYCPHRIFTLCERHQVWHLSDCPQCAAEREASVVE